MRTLFSAYSERNNLNCSPHFFDGFKCVLLRLNSSLLDQDVPHTSTHSVPASHCRVIRRRLFLLTVINFRSPANNRRHLPDGAKNILKAPQQPLICALLRPSRISPLRVRGAVGSGWQRYPHSIPGRPAELLPGLCGQLLPGGPSAAHHCCSSVIKVLLIHYFWPRQLKADHFERSLESHHSTLSIQAENMFFFLFWTGFNLGPRISNSTERDFFVFCLWVPFITPYLAY